MNKKIISLLLIIFLILILISSSLVIDTVNNVINIFINQIFVSLFPFLLISNILINMDISYIFEKIFGKIFSYLFNINISSSKIIIFSLLCGYPSNASFIKEELDKRNISIEEATKLLIMSSSASIMFILNTCGYILLGNIKYGLLILIIVYLSNITIGLIIRNKYPKYTSNIVNTSNNYSISTNIKNSINSSFNTLLIILGNITIFILIITFISSFINNEIVVIISSIILEMTSGILYITKYILSTEIRIILIVFTLIFSSSSINLQVSSILSNYNINFKEVLFYRIITSLIGVIYSIIYFIIF